MNTGKRWIGSLSGAAFLMATSAIGPGFINNTSKFTQDMKSSFGFIILAALVLDIVIQLNIWLTLSLRGRHAQVLANEAVPGSGHVLSILIVAGGFVFNIGNVAGCALGLQLLFGWPLITSTLVSICIAIPVLIARESGKVLDRFAFFLGVLMIMLMINVVVGARPPLQEAVSGTFFPEHIDLGVLLTIVGGTVGGYISFAGAHHLVNAGITGPEHKRKVRAAAFRGIVITSLMRFLLFLAAFGVVAAGNTLSADNPAASVFSSASGGWGTKLFGIILWAASITSVVGCSYTSFSFIQTLHPVLPRLKKYFFTVFIAGSAAFLMIFGKPAQVLVFAGAFNGMILPLSMIILLFVVFKHRKDPDWKELNWYAIPGWIVTALLFVISLKALAALFGA